MPRKYLSLGTLILLSIAAIAGLKNTAAMSEYGLSSISFYLFAAFCFFIPVSLVCAELASSLPGKPGVFFWVKEAYGEKLGFAAVWLEWIQTTVWYPVVLSFALSSLFFSFNPTLSSDPKIIMVGILIVYYLATFLSLNGISFASKISSIGVSFGVILPALVIIILAITWLILGNSSSANLSIKNIVPKFEGFASLSLLISTFLAFVGMEINAVHIKETKNPAKEYPKAIFISLFVVLSLLIFTTLAVSVLVPKTEISLTAGIIQAFSTALDKFNLGGFLPVFSLLVFLGVIGTVTTWISGPSRGLFEAGKTGLLPRFLQKENSKGIQSNLLILQAIWVTIICSIFLTAKNLNNIFFLLSALQAQLYLLMYVILFVSAIKLRITQPNLHRPFKVPFIFGVASLGALASISAIIIGFFPPAQLTIPNPLYYIGFLVVEILILGSAPFVIYHLKKPSWKL